MSGIISPEDRPVLATYLHLATPDAFRPSYSTDPSVTVIESREPSVRFYRFLYDAVGSDFSWVDRLRWSDADLHAWLSRPDVTVLVLYVLGTPAGYAELVGKADEPGTEVKYIGVFPEFHGRGLGKHLLSAAVQRALDDGADRVWLSTRSTDGPRAIPNYERRGFTAYRTEWEPAPIPYRPTW